MKEYKCTLDAAARYMVPGLILLILILITVTQISVGVTFSQRSIPALYIGVIPIVIISIAMFILSPLSVTVDDHSIMIIRRAKPVTIEFSDIAGISKVADMKFALRTFGNGGLFGYTGQYYKKGIGSMTWYCTQRKNYLLIEKTNGKKIVITPDDPDGLIQDIKQTHPYLVTTDQAIP